MSISNVIFYRLSTLIERFTQREKQPPNSSMIDVVYQEMQRIERTLSKMSNQDTFPGSKSIKPITDQQKIIDLAG
jgi:hypothetical protein